MHSFGALMVTMCLIRRAHVYQNPGCVTVQVTAATILMSPTVSKLNGANMMCFKSTVHDVHDVYDVHDYVK